MVAPRKGLLSTLVAGTLGILACAPRWPEGLVEPSRELVVGGDGLLRTYDNGLVLFVAPDPRTELLQVDVRQRVGSRDDPPGKAGLAHLVEHLMFQISTAGPGSPSVAAELRAALSFNAATSLDETDYTQTGTAEDLEPFLRVTAARLGADCRSIDDARLAREKEVVRLEHAWRRETILPEIIDEVLAQAFPEGHPYRRTMIPADDEFASITREDVCAFMDRYYTAGQASVVITGDVDPVEVAALVERYLARLPNITVEPRETVPAAALGGRTVEVAAPVKRPAALLLYELPPRFTAEHAAARVAFAMAPVFVLVGEIVAARGSKRRIATSQPVVLGAKASTLVGVVIETERPDDLAAATQRALRSIQAGFDLTAGGTAFREVYDQARQRRRLELLDEVASIEHRGRAYADYLEEGDEPGFLGAALATVDGLSGDAVQLTGRKVFARARALVVDIVPGGSAERPRLDRAPFEAPMDVEEDFATGDVDDDASAHAPLPFTPRVPDRANIRRIVLGNGLVMVLARSTEVPVLDVRIVVGAGHQDALDERPEVPALVASMYGARDDGLGQSVMAPFERTGAEHGALVRRATTTYFARGLAIYLDYIIAAMAELVVEPEFERERFEAWHDRRRSELAEPSARRDAALRNTVRAALYGEGHPYARPESARPEDLDDTGRYDIEAFRREHVRADNTTVVVSGGFPLNFAADHIEGHFRAGKRRGVDAVWLAKGDDEPRPPVPEPKPGDVRLFTEVDDRRAQTELTVMFPLAEVVGPDHAALAIAVEMLDVALLRLREQLGLTYGVDATLDGEEPKIVVHGFVDSARAVEGLAAVEAVLGSLRAGDAFDRRFVAARRSLVHRMLDRQGDPRAHADLLAEAIGAGLPLDYFDHLPQHLAATTPAQVRAQIDRVLAPDRNVTLVQGPKRAIEAVRARAGRDGRGAIRGARYIPSSSMPSSSSTPSSSSSPSITSSASFPQIEPSTLTPAAAKPSNTTAPARTVASIEQLPSTSPSNTSRPSYSTTTAAPAWSGSSSSSSMSTSTSRLATTVRVPSMTTSSSTQPSKSRSSVKALPSSTRPATSMLPPPSQATCSSPSVATTTCAAKF